MRSSNLAAHAIATLVIAIPILTVPSLLMAVVTACVDLLRHR